MAWISAEMCYCKCQYCGAKAFWRHHHFLKMLTLFLGWQCKSFPLLGSTSRPWLLLLKICSSYTSKEHSFKQLKLSLLLACSFNTYFKKYSSEPKPLPSTMCHWSLYRNYQITLKNQTLSLFYADLRLKFHRGPFWAYIMWSWRKKMSKHIIWRNLKRQVICKMFLGKSFSY